MRLYLSSSPKLVQQCTWLSIKSIGFFNNQILSHVSDLYLIILFSSDEDSSRCMCALRCAKKRETMNYYPEIICCLQPLCRQQEAPLSNARESLICLNFLRCKSCVQVHLLAPSALVQFQFAARQIARWLGQNDAVKLLFSSTPFPPFFSLFFSQQFYFCTGVMTGYTKC